MGWRDADEYQQLAKRHLYDPAFPTEERLNVLREERRSILGDNTPDDHPELDPWSLLCEYISHRRRSIDMYTMFARWESSEQITGEDLSAVINV